MTENTSSFESMTFSNCGILETITPWQVFMVLSYLVGVDPDGNTKSPCQPKVCQFNNALVVNEEVLGLEVPVKDTTTVTEVYALQDLVMVALKGGE